MTGEKGRKEKLVSDITSRKNKEAEFQSSGCPLHFPLGTYECDLCVRACIRATNVLIRVIRSTAMNLNLPDVRFHINDSIVVVLHVGMYDKITAKF